MSGINEMFLIGLFKPCCASFVVQGGKLSSPLHDIAWKFLLESKLAYCVVCSVSIVSHLRKKTLPHLSNNYHGKKQVGVWLNISNWNFIRSLINLFIMRIRSIVHHLWVGRSDSHIEVYLKSFIQWRTYT